MSDDGNPTGHVLDGGYHTNYNAIGLDPGDNPDDYRHTHRQPCEFLGCDELDDYSTDARRAEVAAFAVEMAGQGKTHEEYVHAWNILPGGPEEVDSASHAWVGRETPVSAERYEKIVDAMDTALNYDGFWPGRMAQSGEVTYEEFMADPPDGIDFSWLTKAQWDRYAA